MVHRNAPLSLEGRRRLVERRLTRPIAHVAAEMGISRACASKWVNRYRQDGELGLLARSSAPHRRPTAISAEAVARIEDPRRTQKWSASRIAHAEAFPRALLGSRHQRITPCTPRHNGQVERCNRIISEEFLYARTGTSEDQRREALGVWNIHHTYHRPHTSIGNQPRRLDCETA